MNHRFIYSQGCTNFDVLGLDDDQYTSPGVQYHHNYEQKVSKFYSVLSKGPARACPLIEFYINHTN